MDITVTLSQIVGVLIVLAAFFGGFLFADDAEEWWKKLIIITGVGILIYSAVRVIGGF